VLDRAIRLLGEAAPQLECIKKDDRPDRQRVNPIKKTGADRTVVVVPFPNQQSRWTTCRIFGGMHVAAHPTELSLAWMADVLCGAQTSARQGATRAGHVVVHAVMMLSLILSCLTLAERRCISRGTQRLSLSRAG
jgi:hypothetical protein